MDAEELVLTQEEADLARAGAKAATLSELARADLPVPAFFVVGVTAYRAHLARLGPGAPVPPDAAGLPRLREAIASAPLDPELARAVLAAHAALGAGPVAVRSSGTAEDLPGDSFAGQHGTYFASGAEEMLLRLTDCWASLWSDRAFAYRVRRGASHAEAGMAVIVQTLVAATSSGVAFSVDPVTGNHLVTLEACHGIGEALVSGRVTPDRFVLSRPDLDILERVCGSKPIEVVPLPNGRVVERTLSRERAAECALSDDAAREAARLALRAEGVLGVPADVEWALGPDGLAVLQARPITTLPAAEGAPAAPRTAWSNVNTGEVLPGVITPMTHSVVGGLAVGLLDSLFGQLGVRVDADRITTLIGGRLYFNASLLGSAFDRMLLFGGTGVKSLFGGMDAEPGTEMPPTDPADLASVSRFGLWVGIPRVAVWAFAHRPSRALRFLARERRATRAMEARIASVDDSWTESEVASLTRDVLGSLDHLVESLAFTGVGMAAYTALTAATSRWFDDEHGALANRLLGGRGGVVSAESGLELASLASFARTHPRVLAAVMGGLDWEDTRSRLASGDDGGRAEFLARWDAFMDEHGHHTRGELELSAPRWREDPYTVLVSLRALLTSDTDDLLANHARRGEEALVAEAGCLERLRGRPLRRALFFAALRQAVRGARTRENLKSEGVRRLAAARGALLALGDRMTGRGALTEAGDVFFLRWAEVEAVRAGEMDASGPVAERRALHERWLRIEPPPVVIGEWDGRPRAAAVAAGDELAGLAVSPGIARGPARVIASVLSEERLLPGEILVAPFTDPGWTPWFAAAAGVVVDMGGMLSHGSIIAREYGLPAVVNVATATGTIRTGDLVEVDGDRGVVRVLERFR